MNSSLQMQHVQTIFQNFGTHQPGTPAHVVMQPFTPAFIARSQPGTPMLIPSIHVAEPVESADVALDEQADGAEVKTEAGWSLV